MLALRATDADPTVLGGRHQVATPVRAADAAVASRPATWRIILLPLDGTPAIVRHHVETNRARTLARIELFVRWAADRPGVPDEFDLELTARAILSLAEEAGRMVLTDPASYSPERYEQFVQTVMGRLWPACWPRASRR